MKNRRASVSWRKLMTFRAVAQERSFSRAAQNLFLSQPAVSTQIRLLETHYGIPLFDRIGKKVFLTDAGTLLLDYVQRISNLAEEAEQAIDEIKGLKQGNLKIGASLLVGSYMLPAVIGAFQSTYKGIDIKILIRYAPIVESLVEQNKVDIGLVGSPSPHTNLVTVPMLADELVVVVPATHPWSERISISPSEFCHEKSVFAEEGSSTRRVVLDRLREYGLEPNIQLELGHTEAVKRAVELGLGISIISKHAVATELETGRLISIDLEGVDLHRSIGLIVHKDKRLSSISIAFLKLLQEEWGCDVGVLNEI